jgi:MoxR-like ATPase
MAERQVTVDAQRYALSSQFFVIATQNPVDQHGTYPLPEAQLDRFAMKLSVGYPGHADEVRMLRDAVGGASRAIDGQPILELQQLNRIQELVAALSVAPRIQDYLVRLAHESRRHPSIALGLSPRGLLTWQRVAQSRAWLRGRTFVTPDDVQDVAEPVLSVRLGLEATEASSVIQEILSRVAVPEYQE